MEEKKISKKEANKLLKKDAKNKIKETMNVQTTVIEENDQSKDLYGDLKMSTKEPETKISNIDTKIVDSVVKISGWLQKVRKTGKQAFMIIRRGSHSIQCIAYVDATISNTMVKYIDNIPKESFVEVHGKVTAVEKPVESCTQSNVEISVTKMYVISRAQLRSNLQYEDAARPESGDDLLPRVNLVTRLDNRHIDLRTPTTRAIFVIESAVLSYFQEYLLQNDFLFIKTPSIIGGASEGGASVFELEYFGQKSCLAQSPQFHKQMAIVGGLERVYVMQSVFRAENSNTHRHLCEFNGLDLEMVINHDYHEVIEMISNTLFHIFDKLAAKNEEQIATVHKQYPATPFEYIKPALVLEYCEGVAMLRSAGVEMGDHEDLTTANEKFLGRLVKQKYATDFFVLDKFPLAVRPFYTMPDCDYPGYSNSYDMFMRGEEIMSGAQRIHDATQLRESAIAHGINPNTMNEYLDSFKDGCPPHGGGGIGLERVVMLYLGLSNIRLASLYPRDPTRISP